MPTQPYDAIAVFGSQLTATGKFPDYVYNEIDYAVGLLDDGAASTLVFCGSHALKHGLQGRRECEVAAEYLGDHHPGHLPRLRKEARSTSIPEKWLFTKTGYPDLHRIHVVTIEPLLPRIRFLGNWIYGDEGELSFTALPWPNDAFSDEPRLLQDAECALTVRGIPVRGTSEHEPMARGDHRRLLNEDGSSRWDEIRRDHYECDKYGGLHHP
ncbi:MAG TPA: hypothetical protein VLI05_00915 [Candidatus Saccharimonadia bacterium]|nr:hypothetical protein [Candidatus Saccharimonadia bacterium]